MMIFTPMLHNRLFPLLAAYISALTFLYAAPFISKDHLKLRSVGAVEISSDGKRIAYTVDALDQPGRRYSQIWVLSIEDGKSTLLAGAAARSSETLWSPDGRQADNKECRVPDVGFCSFGPMAECCDRVRILAVYGIDGLTFSSLLTSSEEAEEKDARTK